MIRMEEREIGYEQGHNERNIIIRKIILMVMFYVAYIMLLVYTLSVLSCC